MKKLLLSFVAMAILSTTNVMLGQSYKAAFGGRLGADYGLSFKYFTTEKTAIDFQLTNRLAGYNLAAILTQNYPIRNVEHLSGYVGGGAHYGIVASKVNGDIFGNQQSNSTAIGVDAVAGLEYYVEELNTAIAIDVQPRFEKVGKEFNDSWYIFGLSLRYCVSK